VRSVLILVRPGTAEQWKAEMQEKINEAFEVYDTRPSKKKESERIIVSIDTAKQKNRREQFLGRAFDLVIVDEAHRLYQKDGSYTQRGELVNKLQRKYLLLLTATPIRSSLTELHTLVALVRPGQFPRREEFTRRYMDSRSPDYAARRQELKSLLAEVMIRNRRRDSAIRFPQKRDEQVAPIPMTETERRCYEAVERAIRLDCAGSQSASSFERISTYRPLLQAACVSRHAVADLIEARQTLRAQPHWQQVVALAYQPGVDSKESALLSLLQRLDDRMIVYVEHPSVAQRLYRLLVTAQPPLDVALYLQQKDRQDALKQFRQSRRGVLLAGRPVEESLNLQFCHLVMNYDIPWDPTRLEQRIGRVHRLGQQHPVSIFSLASQGSFTEYLLSLYRHDLRLFDLEVGELGMVLDEMDENLNFESKLWELWLKYPASADQVSALNRIGSKLAQARSDFEQTMRGVAEINDIFEG
jgi:SNF2 family DNA or RNA helicase